MTIRSFVLILGLFFLSGNLFGSLNTTIHTLAPESNELQLSCISILSPSQDEIDIKVSPNPAQDQFSVVANISFSKIYLYNVIGKQLKTYTPSLDNIYYLNDLPGGLYILRFRDNNNQLLKTIKLYKKS